MRHSISIERDIIWEDTTASCTCGWSESHEGYAPLVPLIQEHIEENGGVYEGPVSSTRVGLFGEEI